MALLWKLSESLNYTPGRSPRPRNIALEIAGKAHLLHWVLWLTGNLGSGRRLERVQVDRVSDGAEIAEIAERRTDSILCELSVPDGQTSAF